MALLAQKMHSLAELFIGVDIGTESVRAGLFDTTGHLVSVAKRGICTWHGDGAVVEQSTDQIWHCVVEAVRELVTVAKGKANSTDKNRNSLLNISNGCAVVAGIGFCATCSLAVIGARGEALSVGNGQQQTAADAKGGGGWVRNVIMWMDQRAVSQADRINAIGHPVLRFIGGRISPEMQAAKLLWLKEHVPDTFSRAAHFFDLADFCTWRATESTERSMCTLTCKWTFLGHEQRWEEDFFRVIGLEEIVNQKFQKIGQKVLPIGAKVGKGLSTKAANEFWLPEGTPVGVGLVDAHAGALGTLSGEMQQQQQQMALILGTSLCTMNLTQTATFVHGIWGPYYGVVYPHLWLNEGGMSCFGSALLFALQLHPFYHALRQRMDSDAQMLGHLEQLAIERAGSVEACSTFFGKNLHVVPEFLGNRSPDADPMSIGMVAGLRMDNAIWVNEGGLVEWMMAVLCALCYGLKLIIDRIELQSGTVFAELIVSGGMARNKPLLQLIADITQKCVFVPHCDESMLLGCAIVGAVASGKFGSIGKASAQLVTSQRHIGKLIEFQRTESVQDFHRQKFSGYMALKQCGQTIRQLATK